MWTIRLALIGALTLGALILPAVSSGQMPAGVPRIGTLTFGANPDQGIQVFVEELRRLGYIDGQNIVIEGRYAEGRPERLPGLAAELVRLKVDLIFTLGTDVSVSAKNATTEIPVVFLASGDPIGVGLVSDLARPGGT